VLRLLAARFPNCESLVIAECGHSAFWEQPEQFNRAVLDFISKH
jgi:pimeloyl-ACP methyl ester carboxylesterase